MARPVFPPAPPAPGWSGRELSLHPLRRIAVSLQESNFRWFLGGSFLSNLGNWMQSLAQAWLVLELTNSPFFLGLDSFAHTIPLALFAFWGGMLADRLDRRRLLMAMQWCQMGVAVFLGTLLFFDQASVPIVIICSFAIGMTQAIAWPVYQSLMATLVSRKHLPNAIALNSLQFNVARMIGPMAGSLALTLFGVTGCFFANAFSFLPALYALWRMKLPSTQAQAPSDRRSFWKALVQTRDYLSSERPLMWFLISLSMSSLLGFSVITLLPLFASAVLSAGTSGLGLLYGGFGAGAVSAGLFVAFKGDFHPKGRFALRCLFLFGLAMGLFSQSHDLLLSVLALSCMGFGMVGFASVTNMLLQATVPDHLRGRATSVFVAAVGGALPFGNLIAGSLASALGGPTAVLLQAGVLCLYVLGVYFGMPKVRQFDA